MERFDPARLTGREVVGDGEGAEVDEPVFDTVEPSLELDGSRGADPRGLRIRSDDAQGIAEDLAPVDLIGDAESTDEGERFVAAKVVLVDRREERILVLRRECGEREGERGSEGSSCEALVDEIGAAEVDRETSHDPARLLAEETRGGPLREAILANERGHDPRLVEDRDRARRSVGGEEEPLVFGDARRLLDDDGDLATAVLTPARQALESVDQLEAIALERSDTERKVREKLRAHRGRTWTKRCVGHGDALDRDEAHWSLSRPDRMARREERGCGCGCDCAGHADLTAPERDVEGDVAPRSGDLQKGVPPSERSDRGRYSTTRTRGLPRQ
jgi:hypothetical protein